MNTNFFNNSKLWGRNRQRFLLFTALIFLFSCSPSTRQIFFDIPPDNGEEAPSQEQAKTAEVSNESGDDLGWEQAVDTRGRPQIESVNDWQQLQSMLPQHPKGEIDWNEALEQGLIRPRTGPDPSAAAAEAFKFDFIIESEKPKFNAWFPHSAHTVWLGCQNCHGEIFPMRRNPISMKEMRKGESCGACHGKVAFSLKQCKLCHTSM